MQLEQETRRIDSAASHQGRFFFTEKTWYSSWDLHIYDLEAFPPKHVRVMHLSPIGDRVAVCESCELCHGLRAVACNGDLLLVFLQ